MSHLNWAVLFGIVAVLASRLGFAVVAETSAGVAAAFMAAFVLVLLAARLTGLRSLERDPTEQDETN